MARLVNLTPHDLTLRTPEGEDITIPPDPRGPARVSSEPGPHYNGARFKDLPVPVYGPDEFGEVTGLPEPEDGVLYVVSALVGAAAKSAPYWRDDILVPGTGPADGAIRENGRIVAITRLKVPA